jgi:hypothetical protein
LLKLGGFVGFKSDSGEQPTREYLAGFRNNIESFFEELRTFWALEDVPAPYDPWLYINNLWAFRLR